MQSPKIMVMGVGNILLSDEGLGVRFLDELAKNTLPDNVELLEGGTAGLELVHLIQDVDFLIIIDALNANAEPGALFRFQPGDLQVIPEQYEVSFHQIGIVEVITMANVLGHAPQTLIFGIQPKSLEWGLEISPEIEALFPRLSELIIKEIDSIQHEGKFASP
ncbi:HyaD/HybD family hydrogenase maturation endopeptidase [Desulfosporosinus nitroreducens]|uniref:HyaD/HybD family hydrogenase maturation endopeptidase n=1 Tax=Desulfosporosinus nitroreducens TaxID=2018668 RepID=A0ABT8QN97_9FIRM|nr:HyaD/HybD family hydrogenase maturation endopeptidase [Desulfosporosinus nitroreducens]MCO1600162.1 HyaD/HybD family hydrogenase maturation endopeptidase [Desulfosporosinus nitroreducens]MDO0822808.1 HyaD/HybD family hydrogenase maturation endopeptidase [Desulfosporosinus nitroreducens]